jgi:hypothetical protein
MPAFASHPAVATPLPPCHPVRVCRAKEVNALVVKKTVEQLQALSALEVGAATAKAGTKIDSAKEVLASRLMDKETAADEQKAKAEELIVAARTTLKATENISLEIVEEINRKWAQRIELRRAADVKIAAAEANAKETLIKATKRAADLSSQAERAVQHDVLRNASKRRRTEKQPDVEKFSGANLSAAYAAAAYGSWLNGSPAAMPAAATTATATATAATATTTPDAPEEENVQYRQGILARAAAEESTLASTTATAAAVTAVAAAAPAAMPAAATTATAAPAAQPEAILVAPATATEEARAAIAADM